MLLELQKGKRFLIPKSIGMEEIHKESNLLRPLLNLNQFNLLTRDHSPGVQPLCNKPDLQPT
jgi:hypothetical protein